MKKTIVAVSVLLLGAFAHAQGSEDKRGISIGIGNGGISIGIGHGRPGSGWGHGRPGGGWGHRPVTCIAKNARGMNFQGRDIVRARAQREAMNKCQRVSKFCRVAACY